MYILAFRRIRLFETLQILVWMGFVWSCDSNGWVLLFSVRKTKGYNLGVRT